jgi:replication factor A3
MDSYVEVVGRVIDANTVQMPAFINLGDDLGELLPTFSVYDSLMILFASIHILDMKLVNDTIELIHDPRFYTKMFC